MYCWPCQLKQMVSCGPWKPLQRKWSIRHIKNYIQNAVSCSSFLQESSHIWRSQNLFEFMVINIPEVHLPLGGRIDMLNEKNDKYHLFFLQAWQWP